MLVFLERTQAHDADPMRRSDEEYERRKPWHSSRQNRCINNKSKYGSGKHGSRHWSNRKEKIQNRPSFQTAMFINSRCRCRNFNRRLLLEEEFMEKYLNTTTMKKLCKMKATMLLPPLVRQSQKKIIGPSDKTIYINRWWVRIDAWTDNQLLINQFLSLSISLSLCNHFLPLRYYGDPQ